MLTKFIFPFLGLFSYISAQTIVETNTFDVAQPEDYSPEAILEAHFNDTALIEEIFNHGCFCSKIYYWNDKNVRGGHVAIDEFDEICKNWFRCRECNDKHIGGSCFDMGYNPQANSLSYELVQNIMDDGSVMYDCSSNTDQCAEDTCLIDVEYLLLMINYLDSLSSAFASTGLADGISCPRTTDPVVPRFCNGTVPDLYTTKVGGRKLTFTEFVDAANLGTLTEEQIETACATALYDLTVVVDGSGSVSTTNYYKSVDFVDDLLRPMTFGVDIGRVTLMQYSRSTRFYTIFSDDKTTVTNEIQTMKFSQYKSGTYSATALQATYDYILSYGRTDVPHYVIFMTDGRSSQGLVKNGINTATQLHNHGVIVFGVGIGSGVLESEVKGIASDPDESYMHLLENFDALDNIRTQLIGEVCLGDRSLNAAAGGFRSAPVEIPDDVPMVVTDDSDNMSEEQVLELEMMAGEGRK